MIGGGVEPAEVGLLQHHGPELFPVVELIVGPGLPVAAAIIFGRWRRIRSRLTGGSAEVPEVVAAEQTAAGAIQTDRRALKPPMI